MSWLLLDFRPAEGSVPALAVAVLVTTCSCVALGMLIGSIGLRARDVFFGANLVYFLMLLVCGVNVANDDLPGWLGAIGRCLPLTHGIEAAREIAAGASLGDVAGLLVDRGADRSRVCDRRVRALPRVRGGGSSPCLARDVLSPPG